MFWSTDWGKTLTWQEQKVGSKGEIVLSQAILKALKLKPGDKVLFHLEGDRITVTKVEKSPVAFP